MTNSTSTLRISFHSEERSGHNMEILLTHSLAVTLMAVSWDRRPPAESACSSQLIAHPRFHFVRMVIVRQYLGVQSFECNENRYGRCHWVVVPNDMWLIEISSLNGENCDVLLFEFEFRLFGATNEIHVVVTQPTVVRLQWEFAQLFSLSCCSKRCVIYRYVCFDCQMTQLVATKWKLKKFKYFVPINDSMIITVTMATVSWADFYKNVGLLMTILLISNTTLLVHKWSRYQSKYKWTKNEKLVGRMFSHCSCITMVHQNVITIRSLERLYLQLSKNV